MMEDESHTHLLLYTCCHLTFVTSEHPCLKFSFSKKKWLKSSHVFASCASQPPCCCCCFCARVAWMHGHGWICWSQLEAENIYTHTIEVKMRGNACTWWLAVASTGPLPPAGIFVSNEQTSNFVCRFVLRFLVPDDDDNQANWSWALLRYNQMTVSRSFISIGRSRSPMR